MATELKTGHSADWPNSATIGRIRFPGADAALMALVNACPSFSDERSALMAAWLRAYDACVCAALMSFPNA